MPTIETSIWMALKGRVQLLSLTPAHTFIWPAEVKPLPAGRAIEVVHLPNRSNRLMIRSAGKHQYQGILQLNILKVPSEAIAGTDPEAVEREVAGKIAEHFPCDLEVSFEGVTVRVTKRPDVMRGMLDGARNRWMTPVSIPYECFA